MSPTPGPESSSDLGAAAAAEPTPTAAPPTGDGSVAVPPSGSLRAWSIAARPRTLTAALAPVLVGTACAYLVGGFRPSAALAALLGAVFIQIGTNFANDVFDAEKGADGPDRLGPTRAVASGLLTGAQMKGGMVVAFGLATVAGAVLVALSGWPVVVIGLASIASGIAYTGGPYPLGYNGLGDVFVFLFFGLVAVLGTTWVQTGTLPAVAWMAALPVGALSTAILAVNNVRDRETDLRAGKRTVAVRFGRRAALLEFDVMLLLAFAVPLAMAWMFRAPSMALPLVALPLAVPLRRGVRGETGRALNPRLGETARLLAVHGLVFAAGIALAGRLPGGDGPG